MKKLLLFLTICGSAFGDSSVPPSSRWFQFMQDCPIAKDCSQRTSPYIIPPPLDFTDETEPNYEWFKKYDRKDKYASKAQTEPFDRMIYGLMGDEPCDEFNTLYLAKLLAHFWPDTPEYETLENDRKFLITTFLEEAETDTYYPEGGREPRYVAAQVKCLAERIRAVSIQSIELMNHCSMPTTCQNQQHALFREDLNLQTRDQPDYEVLQTNSGQLSPSAQRTFGLLGAILWRNNPCDSVGALYLARIMVHFWPNSPQYDALSEHSQHLLDSLFSRTEEVVSQARCLAEQLRASSNTVR